MSSSSLYHLVYHSSATTPFNETALHALLTQARTWNTEHQLTGILLYSEGNIMQVLEGPADEVNGIFERIQRDYRHHDVTKLADGPIAERNFAEWSMGFAVMSPADYRYLRGYHPLTAADAMLNDAHRDVALHELLKTFAQQETVRF